MPETNERDSKKAEVNYMGKWRNCIILTERKLYSLVRIKDPKQFTDNIIPAKPEQIRKPNGNP